MRKAASRMAGARPRLCSSAIGEASLVGVPTQKQKSVKDERIVVLVPGRRGPISDGATRMTRSGVAAFVREQPRTTAASASRSWPFRPASGGLIDGERSIAIVAEQTPTGLAADA